MDRWVAIYFIKCLNCVRRSKCTTSKTTITSTDRLLSNHSWPTNSDSIFFKLNQSLVLAAPTQIESKHQEKVCYYRRLLAVSLSLSSTTLKQAISRVIVSPSWQQQPGRLDYQFKIWASFLDSKPKLHNKISSSWSLYILSLKCNLVHPRSRKLFESSRLNTKISLNGCLWVQSARL